MTEAERLLEHPETEISKDLFALSEQISKLIEKHKDADKETIEALHHCTHVIESYI